MLQATRFEDRNTAAGTPWDKRFPIQIGSRQRAFAYRFYHVHFKPVGAYFVNRKEQMELWSWKGTALNLVTFDYRIVV
jgi:hypothetical protein